LTIKPVHELPASRKFPVTVYLGASFSCIYVAGDDNNLCFIETYPVKASE